jgi:hypothetical protein
MAVEETVVTWTGVQPNVLVNFDGPGRMVLLIPSPAGKPYRVEGEEIGDGSFVGEDKEAQVAAHWCLLGDRYVGVWTEQGDPATDWTFTFRLPQEDE